jgi:hypothetical protein
VRGEIENGLLEVLVHGLVSGIRIAGSEGIKDVPMLLNRAVDSGLGHGGKAAFLAEVCDGVEHEDKELIAGGAGDGVMEGHVRLSRSREAGSLLEGLLKLLQLAEVLGFETECSQSGDGGFHDAADFEGLLEAGGSIIDPQGEGTIEGQVKTIDATNADAMLDFE